MRRIISILALIMIGGSLLGQADVELDTIVKLGGRIILADVKDVGITDVSYMLPDDEQVYSIERKLLEKILFHDGRKEIFNKPVLIMIDDQTDWRTVLITEEKKDVEGLYFRGEVSAKAPPSNSKKRARSNAEIRLKKKSANVGGVIVLITKKEAIGGYGEMPSYYLEGIAYGYEPLPDPDENEIKEEQPGQIKR